MTKINTQDTAKPTIVKDRNYFISWHYLTFKHAEAALQASIEISKLGAQPIIMDLTSAWPTSRISLTNYILRWFDRYSRNSPKQTLMQFAQSHGISVIKMPKKKTFGNLYQCWTLFKRLPKTISELENWNNYGILGPALASDLVTQIAMDEFARISRFRLPIIRAICSYLRTFEFVSGLLDEYSNSGVVVFNGRLTGHAGVWSAANDHNRQVLFYEVGRTPFFFFEDFRPHDRIRVQQTGILLQELASRSEIDDAIRLFTLERKSDGLVNRFLELQPPYERNRKVIRNSEFLHAVIFTSSPEELVGVGPSWDAPGWGHQYEALNLAASSLLNLGFQVTVRIHPNIATKSWGEFSRAVKAFNIKNVNVILPHDPVNSYTLFEEADVILVWRSTIGLEASSAGKATYCLGPTRYDQTADVVCLKNQSDLIGESFSNRASSSEMAVPGILWSVFLGKTRRHVMGPDWIEAENHFQKIRRFFEISTRPIQLLESGLLIFNRPMPLISICRRIFGMSNTRKLIRTLYRINN